MGSRLAIECSLMTGKLSIAEYQGLQGCLNPIKIVDQSLSYWQCILSIIWVIARPWSWTPGLMLHLHVSLKGLENASGSHRALVQHCSGHVPAGVLMGVSNWLSQVLIQSARLQLILVVPWLVSRQCTGLELVLQLFRHIQTSKKAVSECLAGSDSTL